MNIFQFLGIRAVDKKPDMDIGDKARSIKDRFEKGQIFNNDEDEIDGQQHQRAQEEDMAVFEQGLYRLITKSILFIANH